MTNIVKAIPQHSEIIFQIFKECKTWMDEQQIFQWTDHYPNQSTIDEDIKSGNMYSFIQNNKPVGVIVVNDTQDEEYKSIDWKDKSGKVAVIHRLAVHPQQQKQGIARKLMGFAESLALEDGYVSIRLDAYTGNPRALQFYENRGYEKRGELYFTGRILPFSCYEKQLG